MSQHFHRAWAGAGLAVFCLFSTQALSQSTSSASTGAASTLQALVSSLMSTATGNSDNSGVLTRTTTPVLSGQAFSATAPAGAGATPGSPALAAATGAASANLSFAAIATNQPLVNPNTLFTFGAANPLLPLNRGLSIFVSDVDSTAQVKFSEVFQQLSNQAGGNPSALTLFHQMFDSENVSPGVGPAVHCDIFGTPPAADAAVFKATVKANGFPYRCPRVEGTVESVADPFTNESITNPNSWSAIAFSNRFDLAVSPTDCGEYRIVFARNSGIAPVTDASGNFIINNAIDRNLMIFEARVPNPRPWTGLNGCKPILDFWHGLSNPVITTVQRGQMLHDFYLHGLPQYGVGPIVSIYNYSFGHGQIRTNQFINLPVNANPGNLSSPRDWTLREFKTAVFLGRLAIVPDTTKTNPGAALFAAGATDPRVALLALQLNAQISNLLGGGAIGNINKIGLSLVSPLQNILNAFESDEAGPSQYGDLVTNFADPDTGVVGGYLNAAGVENPALQSLVQNLLNANGAAISTLQAVKRVRTQTCAGCHVYSDHDDLGAGAIWPDKTAGDANHNPMKFTQESELLTDQKTAVGDPNGKRWGISSAVECFLDNREAIMRTALNLPVPANLLTVPSVNCPSS